MIIYIIYSRLECQLSELLVCKDAISMYIIVHLHVVYSVLQMVHFRLLEYCGKKINLCVSIAVSELVTRTWNYWLKPILFVGHIMFSVSISICREKMSCS